MSASVKLLINPSISQISCNGLNLNQQQMRTLPKLVQKSIKNAFSELSTDPQIQSLLLKVKNRKQLCLHLERGRLFFKPVGDQSHHTSSLRALDFPHLLQALARLQDAARLYLPEALKKAPSFKYHVGETRSKPVSPFSALEAVAILGDVHSIVENALEMSGKESVCIPAVAAIGGGVDMLVSANSVREQAQFGWAASKCKDREGLVQAGLLGGAGVTGLVGSASNALFGTTLNWCGLGAGGMILASSAHSLQYIPSFRKGLREIIAQVGVPLQKKAEQGILFLQQQIALTEGDLRELALKYPPSVQREKAKKKKLQEKWDKFVRRVGSECARKVAIDSAKLLEEVRSGKLHGSLELLQMATQDSSAQVMTQIALLCLALLGMTASIIAIMASASISSSVLFAISAMSVVASVLSLFVDCSFLQERLNNIFHKIGVLNHAIYPSELKIWSPGCDSQELSRSLATKF